MIRLSGRFRCSLIIGGQGIRARKMRTLLSMLSLFLGVLAVVVVQAGAEIAQRAALSNIELTEGRDGTWRMNLPGNAAVATVVLDTLKGRTDAVVTVSTRVVIGEPGVSPVNAGGQPFDQPGGYEAAPRAGMIVCDPSGNCYPVGGGFAGERGAGDGQPPPGMAIELRLVGLSGDVRPFRPYHLTHGNWLDFGRSPSMSPGLVLNRKAAVGFARYPVPAEMDLPGAVAHPTPRILGVVDDGGFEPTAYVRMDELLNWLPGGTLGGDGQGEGIEVLLAPGARSVERVLKARLAGAGLSPDQMHIERINSKERIGRELAIVRWIFLGMAGLVLLIGVAGILNVGLATVGERVEEFALRRAVGTPRSLLAGIVLAETLLTGLFTAGAAIGTGVVALKILGPILAERSQEPFLQNLQFPWQAGVAGVVAGLVAGLLGGLIPAIRAARIPIATVMRA
jgi:putative ABC transport system permease protein